MTPPASIEEVCERLARYWDGECGAGRSTPETLAPRQASVLVPLVSSQIAMEWAQSSSSTTVVRLEGGSGGVDGGVHVLLCTRSTTLSSHAGEVCLPGGKNEPGESDREAALREAHEEVGLPPDAAAVAVLAQLPPFLSKGMVSVRPVVARIISQDFTPTPNADEVDATFLCPLEGFLSPGGGYSYKDWEFMPGRHIRVHYFQRGPHLVWGLTAVVLIRVAEVAYGRPPAFDMVPPGPGATDIQHVRADGSERVREPPQFREEPAGPDSSGSEGW